MSKIQKLVFTVVFNTTNGGKLNSNGKALVQIRCYQGGKCRFISTKVEVAPKDWDSKNKKVKKTESLYDAYNKQIYKLLSDLEAFEVETYRKFGKSTLDHLPLFNQETCQSISFSDYCAKELDRPEIRPDTRRGQRSTLKKLKEFNQQIKFDELIPDLIREFDRFLRRQGLHQNSIHKHHRCVKTYINLAISSEKFGIDKNPYSKIKLKTIEPIRVYLTLEELAKIENLVIPEKMGHLVQIKKMFLFECYTGLRYGDLCRISEQHLTETTKGLELSIVTQKTEKPLTLPLWALFKYGNAADWSEPERILRDAKVARKANYQGIIPLNEPFFKLSLQYYNRGLKDLAKLADIRKKISSHVARHTFGSAMAALVPIPITQKLLTHSKSSQTDIYTHMSNHVVIDALLRIDWKQNQNENGQRKEDRVSILSKSETEAS